MQLTGSNVEQTIGGLLPAKAQLMGISDGSNIRALTGNRGGTLLASAGRSAYTSAPLQTNYNGKGILIMLDVTAASGTGGLKIFLIGISGGTNVTLAPAMPTAPITAVGRYGFVVMPGIGAAPTGVTNAVVGHFNTGIPLSWFVDISVADASNYTYSLSYSYLGGV